MIKKEIVQLNKIKNDRKKAEKRLDALWRECALLRAGNKCEYWGCYKTEHLNIHHVFSRSSRSTRWDLDNAMVLCAGHHSLNTDSAHKDPTFMMKVIGDIEGIKPLRTKQWLILLERKAKTPQKMDLNLELLYLKNELANLS